MLPKKDNPASCIFFNIFFFKILSSSSFDRGGLVLTFRRGGSAREGKDGDDLEGHGKSGEGGIFVGGLDEGGISKWDVYPPVRNASAETEGSLLRKSMAFFSNSSLSCPSVLPSPCVLLLTREFMTFFLSWVTPFGKEVSIKGGCWMI